MRQEIRPQRPAGDGGPDEEGGLCREQRPKLWNRLSVKPRRLRPSFLRDANDFRDGDGGG